MSHRVRATPWLGMLVLLVMLCLQGSAAQVEINADMLVRGQVLDVPRRIAAGTLTLNLGSIASEACSAEQTVAVAGTVTAGVLANVVATDTVTMSFNSDPVGIVGFQPLTTGTVTIVPYPTAGGVAAKVCNGTLLPIDPGTVILNWQVLR